MEHPILPLVNDLSRPFWSAAEAGELYLPWCTNTEQFFWPPSPASPFVSAGPTEWRPAPKGGILASVVVYRRSFHSAFASAMPYGVGLLELDVGPRLRVHIADPSSEDRLKPGDRVKLGFAALADGAMPVPVAEREID